MLHLIPESILVFITAFVAANSLKDMLSMKRTSKLLNKACEDREVLRACSLREIQLLLWPAHPQRKDIDNFFDRLRWSRNPEYCFRVGLINLCERTTNFGLARDLLQIAAAEGYDAAKYVLTMLYIFSGDRKRYTLGISWLTKLWKKRCLFKCRRMIEESIELDRCWRHGRQWPPSLEFSMVCNHLPAGIKCIPPKLKKGVWIAFSDEDYSFDTCLGCRLDKEVLWFIDKIGYNRPEQPQVFMYKGF